MRRRIKATRQRKVLCNGWLHQNIPIQLKEFVILEMGWKKNPGPVLSNLDSELRPRAVCIAVRAVAGRACGTGHRRKEFREIADGRTNHLSLRLRREKPFCLGLSRIPILVPDPGHSPMNVGRSGVPEIPQQSATFARIRELTLYGGSTKVRGAVNGWIEHASGDTCSVRFEQTRTNPALRQAIS